MSGLKVIARTSAFAFKGQQTDIRTIADALGVANILEGSGARATGDPRDGAARHRRRWQPSLVGTLRPAVGRCVRRAGRDCSGDSMARAREFCQRAIALDPQYALAHTLYADYLFGRTTVWMSPMREVNPLIRAAALRALELDPDLRDAGALVRNGDREGGREVLRSLGSPESYGVSIGWALFHTPAANSMPPPSGSRVR